MERPSPREFTAAVELEAGRKYDLKLEFYERYGGAMAKLEWSSPSQNREVIPENRLFHGTGGGGGDTAGPTFSEVSVQPQVLSHLGGQVVVKAKVSDPSGIRNVSVLYGLPTEDRAPVPMTHHEGYYTATLNFRPNQSGRDLHYTVSLFAVDLKGNTSTHSVPGGITVRGGDPGPTLTVLPSDVTLLPGQTQQFRVEGLNHVHWSVEGGSVNGSIEQNGTYRAPTHVSPDVR